MSYRLRFTPIAVRDIERHKKSGDKKVLQKIEKLLEELKEHPRTGTGKPEERKYDLEGYYSRRINRRHRLVYEIKEEFIAVLILSAYAHYGDK